MIEIRTLGGYGEVGKNCTAVRIDDEVVILDMGIHLENYIAYTEDEDLVPLTAKELIKAKAVPDISYIKEWRKDVKAIIPTHAHLDHIGAIPFLSNRFNAEILATPYTCSVLKKILKDEKISLKNTLKKINPNSRYKISDKITVEFINITHSTPHTVMIVLHTPYGILIYANDFKFDLSPTLGQKPNMKRIEELGKKGVLALFVECLYSGYPRKTPSERVAKEMLKEVMLGTKNKGKAVVITTFSSHLARLKSIVEFGKKMKRKIIFLGRSLNKYVSAGEDVNIINFSDDVKLAKYRKQARRELKKVVADGKDKYLLVVTGHQGEPRAMLNRMVDSDFDFSPEDIVIFSCQVIPSETNEENRKHLEDKLKQKGVRLFIDIHTSGHASREDLRDLINILKPLHLIPAHGNKKMMKDFKELAVEMGYIDKNIHLLDIHSKLIL